MSPRVDRKMLSAYVIPEHADAIAQLADNWNCSVSDAIRALIAWGVHGLQTAAVMQDRPEIVASVAPLAEALKLGMTQWGPLVPKDDPEELARDAMLAQLERKLAPAGEPRG